MTNRLHLSALVALILGVAHTASADPAVGFGLNITFGGGQMDSGVGIRVFSSDRPNSGAGSIGIDYMLREQKWRATVGAAYLFDRSYVELNGGLQLDGNGLDLGIGGGWVDTNTPTPSATPSTLAGAALREQIGTANP